LASINDGAGPQGGTGSLIPSEHGEAQISRSRCPRSFGADALAHFLQGWRIASNEQLTFCWSAEESAATGSPVLRSVLARAAGRLARQSGTPKGGVAQRFHLYGVDIPRLAEFTKPKTGDVQEAIW
jgi:hypothetical protein